MDTSTRKLLKACAEAMRISMRHGDQTDWTHMIAGIETALLREPPGPATTSPDPVPILHELVALKIMKDRIDKLASGNEHDRLQAEYELRKRNAWAAAFAAVMA